MSSFHGRAERTALVRFLVGLSQKLARLATKMRRGTFELAELLHCPHCPHCGCTRPCVEYTHRQERRGLTGTVGQRLTNNAQSLFLSCVPCWWPHFNPSRDLTRIRAINSAEKHIDAAFQLFGEPRVSSWCLLFSRPVFKLHFTTQQRRSSSVCHHCRCTDMSCAPAVAFIVRRKISELDDVQAFGVHAVCHDHASRVLHRNHHAFHSRSRVRSSTLRFSVPGREPRFSQQLTAKILRSGVASRNSSAAYHQRSKTTGRPAATLRNASKAPAV